MIEEWKVIEENKNYEISTLGRVMNIRNGHILTPNKRKDGYCSVLVLTGFKKYTRVLIHRLVAQAFIPNPNNYKEVNHKDFDTSNNCVDNLEWIAHKDNCLWSSERISKSAKKKKITDEMRSSFIKCQIAKSKNHYPTYIYKDNCGFRYKYRYKGKTIVDKHFKTLEETINYKENWLKDHRKEILL